VGTFDTEEEFKKGFKKASLKKLKEFVSSTGAIDSDDDLKSMTKPEIVEIIQNYMGYNRGGLVTKKYANPVTIINNLKKK
jgi:hypothetical protein